MLPTRPLLAIASWHLSGGRLRSENELSLGEKVVEAPLKIFCNMMGDVGVSGTR
jgi:hypothetical protein